MAMRGRIFSAMTEYLNGPELHQLTGYAPASIARSAGCIYSPGALNSSPVAGRGVLPEVGELGGVGLD